MTPIQIHRQNKRQRKREYDAMREAFPKACWNGHAGHRPNDWFGPWYPNERAHIVTGSPRLEDRRLVILLCSLCHKEQHGEKFGYYPTDREPLTVEAMMRLKLEFDPEFYDFDLMQQVSTRLIPDVFGKTTL